MCDFRIIKQIVFLEHQDVPLDLIGTTLNIAKELHARAHTYDDGTPYFTQVKDVGFYHIAASGSFHAFYTGERWLHERTHYQVTAFEKRDIHQFFSGTAND